MCFVNESNFAAATLLVISELLKVRKDVAMEIFKFGTQLDEAGPAVISIHAKKAKDEDKPVNSEESDDDEEENFQDVDRVLEEQKTAQKKVIKEISKKVDQSEKQYDALKREP